MPQTHKRRASRPTATFPGMRGHDLCTDLSLSGQQILSIYQKRWPIEVDNFYVKQHLGLADFRGQSYEATEKWFAIVFLTFVFLQ
jgi:hypothetical protein